MRRLSGIAAIAILAALMALTAAPAEAAQRWVRPGVFGRPVIVRPYVRPYPYIYYGPGWYGYWGPGWYFPGSYYSWGPSYTVNSTIGEVKIETHHKDASLYVDGGYVGPIDKFRKFGLMPGNHDIELRDMAGQTIFKERVQVILNRTVEIRPPS